MTKNFFLTGSILLSIAFTAFSVMGTAQSLKKIPNQPLGEGKGVHPGRVVLMHNPDMARWDGQHGHWWDEGNIDQEALDHTYEKSLCALLDAKNCKKAWQRLFRHYNQTHGRGKAGYKAGEVIAVKINLNNSFDPSDRDNDIDQSPQALISLLRQLTREAGVSQRDILLYDASRAVPDRIYAPVHKLFPNVRWMSARGSRGVEPAAWVKDAIRYTVPDVALGNALPKAVVEATYLINLALLKGHEIAGITTCAKNHFGSIQWPSREHGKPTVSQFRAKEGAYSALVDLMGCPNLGGKTILYIVDGLYGMQTNVGAPRADRDHWDKLFGGSWSSCYLMSQDPVAIECVCLDMLDAEFGDNLGFSGAPAFPKGSSVNCDNYLKQAALGENAQFGSYRPNGVPTGSLGVFEHWNNAHDRQYSRNLGKDEGIELKEIR